MPALNFKKEFASKVRRNTKPGTIRQIRKSNPIKVGDNLFLFTGMRTSKCTRLAKRKCVAIIPIKITSGFSWEYVLLDAYTIKIQTGELDEFVKLDGFKNRESFFKFFRDTYGESFEGVWIVWKKDALRFWKNNPAIKTTTFFDPL